ncbi:hypothetical protein evm_014749 [Chilo suppressalis]|nr:hypothetical protein evm_014749 [Chilo suppressalis]
MEVGVQTDLFADRPPTPLYVPAKTGADAGTQIYPGDLFDFDLEVQPILEVLVGKTAEQALAEWRRRRSWRPCASTSADTPSCETPSEPSGRASQRRTCASTRRRSGAWQRRACPCRRLWKRARAAAAGVLVQGYLADLLPAVLAGLRDQGHLLERVQRGLDDEFMPWLLRQVSGEVEALITSRDVLTGRVSPASECSNGEMRVYVVCVQNEIVRVEVETRKASFFSRRLEPEHCSVVL